MRRSIDYYLNQKYRIEIIGIPEEEGGGFAASLPQFGKTGIIADGDTIEEALRELETVKRLRFEDYIENGFDIPLPEEDILGQDVSGKILVRMPKFIHRDLVNEAKDNGVSLNSLINCLLASGLEKKRTVSHLDEMKEFVESIKENICKLNYNIESRPTLSFSSFSCYQSDDYGFKAA